MQRCGPEVILFRLQLRHCIVTSIGESKLVLFGRSRSRCEGSAPAPPKIKQKKFLMIFSPFVPTSVVELEPVKKLRAVAVWLRGTVVAK